MEGIHKLCCTYLAFLRALYLIHQNHHWLAKGPSFYAHHQLFEHLYSSAQKNADLAAEKLIGIFGDECLNNDIQMKIMSKLVNETDQSDYLTSSLEAEKKFQNLSKQFYESLKKEDKLSQGLDDLILSIANDREEAIYHLQQSLKGNTMSKLNSLANKIIKKLAQAEDPQQMQVKHELSMRLGVDLTRALKFEELRVSDGTAYYKFKIEPAFRSQLEPKLKEMNTSMVRLMNESIKKALNVMNVQGVELIG